MVTLQQFTQGVKSYAQSGIIPHLPGDRQFAAGVAIGLVTNKADAMLQRLKESQMVQLLGLIDENGMVDDDALFTAMREQMQRQGTLQFDIPWIGRMTFNAQDVDALQRAIQGR